MLKSIAWLPAIVASFGLSDARAITVVYPDSEGYMFSQAERQAIRTIADETEREVRAVLPVLPDDLRLEVREGDDVNQSTGHGAQVLGPGVVAFIVDASRAEGVESIVQAQLRAALFHEMHHLARGMPMVFMDTVISEGMATVFARDFAGVNTPWSQYADEVADWAKELRALEPGFQYADWMFTHPDGRRWIGYTVGTYLVDRAVAVSGSSAAELATVPTSDILELADSF